MKRSVLFILVLFCFVNHSFAKIHFIEVRTQTEWEEVLASAKVKDKVIFTEIYADGCEPCQELDSKAFLDNDLYNYINSELIAVKFSSFSDFGLKFTELNEVNTIPVLYFMDPSGHIISEEIKGYRTAGKILQTAKYYKEQYGKLMSMKEDFYSINRNQNITLSYAFMLLHLKYVEEATVISNQYFRNLDIFSYSPEEWTLVKQYLSDVNNPITQKVIAESASFKAANGKEEVDAYLSELFKYNYTLAIQNKDRKQLENTLLMVDKIDFTNMGFQHLSSIQMVEFFRISYFERIGDWTSYAQKVVDYVANNQVIDTDMRSFIQNFYLFVDDTDLMLVADSWAYNLLKKDKVFDNYIMYSLTQHKTDNKPKAFKLLKKAEKKAVTENDHKTIANVTQAYGLELIP
ncbi:MAG: DUF255 domain-containing protein [Bacteroidetes bacterium]|nr:DUF255 domain-containing protein [Bacteroidota bacterium]